MKDAKSFLFLLQKIDPFKDNFPRLSPVFVVSPCI